MSWVPISNHTRISSIYTHETPCHVPEWLLYIHFLFHYTIQERSLDIHLVNLPFHQCSQSKYLSDGSVSGYMYTIFFIIYSFFLWEAMSHESCFIFLYVAICSMLDIVDPFGSYNRLPLSSWDNIANIILHGQLILFCHSILPLFPFYCFFIVGRFFIDEVT